MKESVHPKIKPLVKDLEKLGIGYYLKTTAFERALIELGFEGVWDNMFRLAKKERTYYSTMSDHDRYDSETAFRKLLNPLFEKNVKAFNATLTEVLTRFIIWKKEREDYSDLIADLRLLKIGEQNQMKITSAIYKRAQEIREAEKEERLKTKNTLPKIVIKELTENKKKWIKLIQKAELEKVAKELNDFSEKTGNTEMRKKAANFLARLSDIKNQTNKGVTTKEYSDVKRTEIIESMIDFIFSLE